MLAQDPVGGVCAMHSPHQAVFSILLSPSLLFLSGQEYSTATWFPSGPSVCPSHPGGVDPLSPAGFGRVRRSRRSCLLVKG